jgi:hypothetical protein
MGEKKDFHFTLILGSDTFTVRNKAGKIH